MSFNPYDIGKRFNNVIIPARKGTIPITSAVLSVKVSAYSFFLPAYDTTELITDTNQMKFIGVIQQISPSFSRSSEPVRTLGIGDRILDQIPSFTEPISVSVSSFYYYYSHLLNLFGMKAGIYGAIRDLRYHILPFDFKETIIGVETEALAYTIPPHDSLIPNQGGDVLNVSDGFKFKPLTSEENAVWYGIKKEGDNWYIITLYISCWLQELNYSFTSDSNLVQMEGSFQARDVMGGDVVSQPSDLKDLVIYSLSALFDWKKNE